MKGKMIKLLENNIGAFLHDLWVRTFFWTEKAITLSQKIDKLDNLIIRISVHQNISLREFLKLQKGKYVECILLMEKLFPEFT